MTKKKSFSFSKAFNWKKTNCYSEMYNNIITEKLEKFYYQKIKSIELDNFKNYIFKEENKNPLINKSKNNELNHLKKEKKRFYGESKNLDLIVDLFLNEKKYKEILLENKKNQTNNFELNILTVDIETIKEDLEIQNNIINEIGYTIKLNNNNKNYLICNFKNCNAYFKSKYYVNKHIKTHIDILPFRCPICGMKFIRKDNGQSHLKICNRKRILNK